VRAESLERKPCRRSTPPGAGGSLARQPGDHHGELTGLPAHEVNQPIAAPVTNSQYLFAAGLRAEQPDVERLARRDENRERWNARSEIIKRTPPLFKKGLRNGSRWM